MEPVRTKPSLQLTYLGLRMRRRLTPVSAWGGAELMRLIARFARAIVRSPMSSSSGWQCQR